MNFSKLCGPVAVALSAGLVLPAQAAPLLESINGIVTGAGGGGCGTSGTVPELAFFGAFAPSNMPPGGLAACGYSGGYQRLTATTGLLTQNTNLGPVSLGLPVQGQGPFFGAAESKVSYGMLGAAAHGQIVGGVTINGQALFESTGAATFADSLTVTSPLVDSFTQGTVRYKFRVDGSLSALGAPEPFFFGDTRMTLELKHGPVFSYSLANATVRRGGLGSVNNGPIPVGWVTSQGSLSGGSDFISLDLPIVWGQEWDFKVGLLAFAYGTSDVDFLSTATLTGFQFFNASGAAVTDFSLSAASGTNYLAPVPEPTVAVLLTFGIALLAWRRGLA